MRIIKKEYESETTGATGDCLVPTGIRGEITGNIVQINVTPYRSIEAFKNKKAPIGPCISVKLKLDEEVLNYINEKILEDERFEGATIETIDIEKDVE